MFSLIFSEGGRERERYRHINVREKHRLAAFPRRPNQGSNPQPLVHETKFQPPEPPSQGTRVTFKSQMEPCQRRADS